MRTFKCRKIGNKFTIDKSILSEVHRAVRAGELVVYPTETLYGLGGDPFNEHSVERVRSVKGRSADLPISMAVSSLESLWFYGLPHESAILFCKKHLPGPVTVLLKATSLAPPTLVSHEGLVGLRVPNNPITIQILRATGPLTATSANQHGSQAPTNCNEAIEQLGEKVSIYVDAGPCEYGRESTVVDLSSDKIRVIRHGALPEEDI